MDSITRRRFLAVAAVGTGLAAAGCVGAARTTEWPMFRAGGDNRASTREHPGDDLDIGWELPVEDLFQTDGGDVRLSSVTADSELAYVTGRFTLGEDPVIATAAIDIAEGTPEWTSERVTLDPVEPDIPPHPPTLWEDYLLAIGGREGHVLERTEGFPAFEIQLPWRPTTIPGGDRALVAIANDDEVAMIDLDEDEDVRWTRTTPAGTIPPIDPMTVLADSIYISGEEAIVQLRRGDGELVWEAQLGDAGHVPATPPLVDGHSLHMRLREDDESTLVAIARNDRTENWRRALGEVDDIDALPAYRAGRLYVAHNDQLESVQVGDGETDVSGAIDIDARYPTIGGDDLYVLSDDELVVVDRHDLTRNQRLSLPGQAAPPPQEAVPRDDALLVTRRDRILGLQPA